MNNKGAYQIVKMQGFRFSGWQQKKNYTAFKPKIQNLTPLFYHRANDKGADQTVRMHGSTR